MQKKLFMHDKTTFIVCTKKNKLFPHLKHQLKNFYLS